MGPADFGSFAELRPYLQGLLVRYQRLAADQPAAVQPAAVQPAAVQPGAVQPGAVQPAAVQPAAVQPAVTKGATLTFERLEKALAARGQPIYLADLCEAEESLVAFYSDVEVRAILPGWRRRLHEVVGSARYALYESNAPKLSEAPALLRADLLSCISAIYYFYEAYGFSALSRTQVTQDTLKVATLVVLVLAACLAATVLLRFSPGFMTGFLPVFPYLLCSAICAVVGSILSVQQRLEDPSIDVDPIYRYVQQKVDSFSISFVSPLFGAILGIGVYLFLISGLVTQGAIVPSFTIAGVPQGSKDIALLFLYAFLGGFAERLVPDALTRLAARTVLQFLGGSGGGSEPAGDTHGSTGSIDTKSKDGADPNAAAPKDDTTTQG